MFKLSNELREGLIWSVKGPRCHSSLSSPSSSVSGTCIASSVVAWVMFGRRQLRYLQEEVGHLLNSNTFNTAARNGTNGDLGITLATVQLFSEDGRRWQMGWKAHPDTGTADMACESITVTMCF